MTFTSAFPRAPLSAVATFINGDRSTNYPKGDDYVEQGIAFISAADLENGRVEYSRARQISDVAYERLRSGKIQRKDILFCLRGSLGKTAYVQEDKAGAIASSLVIVRTKEHVDPRYLFYVLGSQDTQQAAGGLNNGAAQPNLSVTELQRVEIPVPLVSTQRRIAGILSAYDELIENSQRRIELLETMARALYREWFVHFRFPGHENVPRAPSLLGEIPQGWEVGRLDGVLVLQRGFDLPKAARVEGDVPIFAATGITGFHNESKVKAPGVVTGRSGTIGEVIYIQEDFWPLNTALWVKEFPKSEPLYAFYLLLSIDLKQFNSGAAVPTLNRNDVHCLEVVIPPRELQNRFQQIAGTIFNQSRTLQRQIQTLRRTRDLLLPRLLSGQIDVEVLPA